MLTKILMVFVIRLYIFQESASQLTGKLFFGEDETKKVSTYSQRFVNVKQTIHPSENIFHPSVLQFFLDVLSKIDVGNEKPAMPKESREDLQLENSQKAISAAWSGYSVNPVSYRSQLDAAKYHAKAA
jgi:hypothetical protein